MWPPTTPVGYKTLQYYYDGLRIIQEVIEEPGAGSNPATFHTEREYVYGPDYVDEFVAQVDDPAAETPPLPSYMLQDANFNVMALVNLPTTGGPQVLSQYQYEPYGPVAAADNGPGVNDDTENTVGHQGLFFHRLSPGNLSLSPTTTGLYYNRNRWYAPHLGRFLTRDPNGSGAMLLKAAIAGQVAQPEVSLMIEEQYADGMNNYQYTVSNPLALADVDGLAVHHLYPLYLGGPSDGPGLDLDKETHDAFHKALNDTGFPYGEKGRAKWSKLSQGEQKLFLKMAALKAGIDVTDSQFIAALNSSVAEAEAGVLQPRAACRSAIPVRKVTPTAAQGMLRRMSPGLDKLSAMGKGLAVVGGVFAGVQMMDALRLDNPNFVEMASITRKVRNSGQMTIMDEVTVLENLYHLTGDTVSAAYGWEAWREAVK